MSGINWLHIAQQIGAGLVTTGVVALFAKEFLDWRRNRKVIARGEEKRHADAADVLTDTALTLVQPLRDELAQVRAEAQQLRDELRKAVAEGQAALTELRALRVAILDPAATLAALRDLVARSSRGGLP